VHGAQRCAARSADAGAENAVSAILNLGAGDNAGAGGAAVEAKAIDHKQMRIVLARQLPVHVRRRVAMDDDPPVEPTLPLQEIAMDPSPLGIRE
jgi:hypothetical protein